MRARDPHERGRTASTLELFFDLVFVVAVSVASGQLHHALTEAHIADGLAVYAVVFFGIWWAWMNFTWFATSFDTDDWLYRVLTIVQMGGVLVLAAGIEPAFAEHNFTILILSYVVMRIAMVAQWLRASRATGESRRRATLIYAAGITVVQVLWLLQLALPASISWLALIVLIAAELAIPIIAERIGSTPWHPHHITERYGLFTLILLGESLLASANAIIETIHTGEHVPALISVSALTLIVTAALWWIYFWPPHYRAISSFASSLRYGYIHYFVFAAAGALSAGVEIQIDAITGNTRLPALAAAFTLSIPIAVFILGIWWIALRQNADRIVNAVVPVGSALVMLTPLSPVPVVLTAGILIAMVVVLVIRPPLDR
ncbi:MAG: low temperature requirement protein A [Actinobacteria bacterium]|nr:low temperature requirement protein A [Actinomycetota bacterium]